MYTQLLTCTTHTLTSDTIRHASTLVSRIFTEVGTIEYMERGGGSCIVRDVSLKWLAVHTVSAEKLNCKLLST
jgi:hypothetical protein